MSHGLTISGGQFKGHVIALPKTGLRPTQSRVREALFSILEHNFSLSSKSIDVAIDLCAGTGALGIEALSRSVPFLIAVEKNGRAVAQIKRNLEKLHIEKDRYRVIKAEGKKFCQKPVGVEGMEFGSLIIFCDPPYEHDINEWLKAIEQSPLIQGRPSVVVLETQNAAGVELPPGFAWVSQKTYGDTSILILKSL